MEDLYGTINSIPVFVYKTKEDYAAEHKFADKCIIIIGEDEEVIERMFYGD